MIPFRASYVFENDPPVFEFFGKFQDNTEITSKHLLVFNTFSV